MLRAGKVQSACDSAAEEYLHNNLYGFLASGFHIVSIIGTKIYCGLSRLVFFIIVVGLPRCLGEPE